MTVAQMVQSVSDNCPISINDVVIEQAPSDERLPISARIEAPQQ